MSMRLKTYRDRRSPRLGFTLLEVMVAVAVTAMILSIVYSSFARTVESKEYVELGNEAYHKARWAMDKISMDLACAFVHPNKLSNTLFYAVSHEVNAMPMDEIHFTSFSHVRINPMGPESDQCEISYKVAYSPDQQRFQLWRREDAVIDAKPLEGGEELMLLDGISAFNLRLYDGTEWQEQWDSRPIDQLFDDQGNPVQTEVEQSDIMVKAVPAAAEVTIAVLGPDGRPIVFTSKIKIELSPIDLKVLDSEGSDAGSEDSGGDGGGSSSGGPSSGTGSGAGGASSHGAFVGGG
jgi:general secretion pathway protein J